MSRQDHTTFEATYKELCYPLYLYAKNMVPGEDAADIVADVFTKIWEDQIVHINLRALLYTAVKNRCINHIRRKNMIELKHEQWIEHAEIEAGVIQSVREKIEALPEKEKKVLSMAFEGYKNEEIAGIMGLSYQTVSNLKAMAVRKVKGKLLKQ